MNMTSNLKDSIHAQSVAEIIEFISQFPETAIFRGENNIYDTLKPKVGRLFDNYCNKSALQNFESSFESFETSIIDDFVRYCEPYLENVSVEDEVKVLTIGQHYGLPTRLLDWTENILVAIYFAIEGNNESDRRIYIYDTKRIIGIEEVFSDKLTLIHKYYPPIIHKRIISQSSLFTVYRYPYIDMREHVKDGKDQIFAEIQIPYKNVVGIRGELSKLGINGKSIWPDIDGVVKYIEWFFSEKYTELKQ